METSNISGGVGKTLLTGEMAAEYLGLSLRTLERWRVTGDGPRYVKIGRKFAYRPADLEVWMASKTFTTTAEQKRSKRAA